MTIVLGVDAAWTAKEPSGVALVGSDDASSTVLCVAPSYQEFVRAGEGTPVEWMAGKVHGSAPNISDLLNAASKLGAPHVDLIALDIPLAHSPITKRRVSDSAVSKAFGSKGCSTHSPNANRPGPVSAELYRQLADAGFGLETVAGLSPNRRPAIEVYPHPALLVLMGRDYRVPYKVQKHNKYWNGRSLPERRRLLYGELMSIYSALEVALGALPFRLPAIDKISSFPQLKPFEDALDALVCAWVGKRHLASRARPYGDADSAIWIPD